MKSSQHLEANQNWRFEVKYRINIFDYHRIRLAIKPYMRYDLYTRKAHDNKYFVRSLYYDTYDYKLYHEKMNGDHERIKFRLRTYASEFDTQSIIRLEMKVRMGNAMEKLAFKVSPDDYQSFMQTRHWPAGSDPVLQEFERYLHLWNLQPQVLIEYKREGHECRDKAGLRITFDHKVRGAHSHTLFPERKLFYREFHPHGVIMEIKCRHNRPEWLNNIIRFYGLRWVANSKFTQGIQSSRKDLYRPDGVVVIR